MDKNCGIYIIMNLVNGKFYIGSSCNIKNRLWGHKGDLKNNKHHSSLLQRAYNKYGINNFIFTTVENCSKENLLDREQYWLDYHLTYNKDRGYNNLKNARSCKGRIPSEIHKQRISESLKRRYQNMTPEEYAAFAKEKGEKLKGKRKLTPEEIEKFCERMKNSKKWFEDVETFKYIMNKATEAKKKPILQYSLDGIFLKEFPCSIDAAIHIGKNKKHSSMLTAVASGHRKTAYGFIWKYKK